MSKTPTTLEKLQYATYDNITVVKPYMKYIMGSNTGAIFFAHIMFWLGVAKNGGGKYRNMIYKTNLDMEYDTGLSNTEIKTVKKKFFANFKSVTKVMLGMPQKTHYKIDWPLFNKELDAYKIAYYDEMENKWDRRHGVILTKGADKMWDAVRIKAPKKKEKQEENTVKEPMVEVAPFEEKEEPTVETTIVEEEEPKVDMKAEKKRTNTATAKKAIKHLNEVTGKNFRDSGSSLTHALRVVNKDYSLDEIKYVIENKSAQWIGDEKMNGYLRPSTLFSNKFDDYLNEGDRRTVKGVSLSDYIASAEEKFKSAPREGSINYGTMSLYWMGTLNEKEIAYLLLTKRLDKRVLTDGGLRPSDKVMVEVATGLGLKPKEKA